MRQLMLGYTKLFGGHERGFTLPEVLVAISILGLSVGFIGGGFFQAMGVERSWTGDVLATRELRNGTNWFATDALNARTTDLVDSAPAVSSATFSWLDQADVSHVASYSVVGEELIRNHDGSSTVAASRVVSAEFTRVGQLLKLTLTVNSSQGGTDSTTLELFGRVLQ